MKGGVGEAGGGLELVWTQTQTFSLPLAVCVSPPGDSDLDCGHACVAGMDATDKHLGPEQAHLAGSYKRRTLLGRSSRTSHVSATTLQRSACYFLPSAAVRQVWGFFFPTRQVSKRTFVADEL